MYTNMQYKLWRRLTAMGYAIFSDSSCNLPRAQLEEFHAETVSFSYEKEGELIPCPKYPDEFDGKAFYDYLRNKGGVKTSLLAAGVLMDAFRPALEAGQDVLYLTMSSAISGTVSSALHAAELLKEEFPERTVRVLDSLGAGLGVGLLVGRAADNRAAGMGLEENYRALEADRANLCELFTVDDLMFLRRTGRVSGVAAALGTMLQLKPMLRGDETGHITVFSKVRSRKKAVQTLAELYGKKVRNPETQRVYISHGDCLEEAQALEEMIRQIAPPRELITCLHEPLTGSHVGPGMLAVFFLGEGR